MNGPETMAGDWLIVVRAIHFAATAMTVGILIFRTVVAEPALRLAQPTADVVRAQTLGLAWISLVVSIASGMGWMLLQVLAMSGLSLAEAMTADVIGTVVTETQFGQIAELRLVVAIILAACLASDRFWGARWLALASSLGLVAAIAWTGHAGSTPGELGFLHLAADALHLVAAASWIGGLVSLAVVLAVARRFQAHRCASLVHEAMMRFSTLGIASVVALLVTGIVNAAILVGSLQALVVTDYGRLLMLKIALFAVMIGFAAVNRFWLTPRLVDASSEREQHAVARLTRNCIIEIALGLSIFAIVGALGTLHPASHLGGSS